MTTPLCFQEEEKALQLRWLKSWKNLKDNLRWHSFINYLKQGIEF